MGTASSVRLVPHEFPVSAGAPFNIDFPQLGSTGAVCIGLTIEWRHHDALREYARRHTLADEHARAARFLRDEDSLRNLLGRALLRAVASHYGGMDPMREIRVSTWGKPQLEGCSVGCNVSHSGSQLWVAVAAYPHVGIDIESTTSVQEYRDIAGGFHPDEIAALRKSSDSKSATMRCWCRKEAVSKATGLGMSLPLRSYAVECEAVAAGWLRVAPPDTQRESWTTVDLPLGKDYVGALAVEGRIDTVDMIRLKLNG